MWFVMKFGRALKGTRASLTVRSWLCSHFLTLTAYTDDWTSETIFWKGDDKSFVDACLPAHSLHERLGVQEAEVVYSHHRQPNLNSSGLIMVAFIVDCTQQECFQAVQCLSTVPCIIDVTLWLMSLSGARAMSGTLPCLTSQFYSHYFDATQTPWNAFILWHTDNQAIVLFNWF